MHHMLFCRIADCRFVLYRRKEVLLPKNRARSGRIECRLLLLLECC
jgi:hypothetical protein